MGMRVTAHPANLRESAKGIKDVSVLLDEVWKDLQRNADSLGDLFGTDEVGQLLQSAYQALRQVTQDSNASAVRHFDGFAECLTLMAKRYEECEEANAQRLARIGKELH